MQMEYQKSLAQLSLREEEEPDYDKASFEMYRQSHHVPYSVSGVGAAGVEQTIGRLNLASPSPFPAHGQASLAPSPSITSSYSYQQQHSIPQSQYHNSSMAFSYQSQHQTPSLPHATTSVQAHQQQFPQYPVQQQLRVSSSSYDQQLQHRNSNPSPSISTPSYSSGYPYSPSGSIVSSGSWSQPSSPGYPPTSFTTLGTVHESLNSRSSFSDAPYFPPEAQLLIDFNPGILSAMAVAFRQRMLENETKRSESTDYGLEFPVTFTGKEAIDVLIELTHLEDRRHALAIARSMESQQLFFGGGDNKLFDSNNDQYFFSDAALAYLPGKSDFPSVPRGVFPYSSKCYSYGCVPGDATCYSYLCPNRRHITNSLERQNSDASSLGSQEKVWANSVPASVAAAASKKERARQEAIFEVVTTEHNYVRDLELMEEIFIIPLRSGDIIDQERVEEFIEDVFLNYKEIHNLNKKLLEQLRVRQEEQPLVERIGDILLTHVVGFEEAYSKYIPRIALSEFISKKEEARNPKYAQFLRECTRHPEARRLGLLHFVGQPYQRIPRYPLLLNEVVKRTEEAVEDRQTVQEVIKVCSELGKKIEACMPEGALQLRLLKIQDKIIWKSKESQQDLKLNEKTRRLLFECVVKRRATFDVQATEFRLFVFDHLLLMTKEKRDKQGDKDGFLYQVHKNPIPLELANVFPDDGKPVSLSARDYLSSRPRSRSSAVLTENNYPDSIASSGSRDAIDTKFTAPVTVHHRGRRGGDFMFYMPFSEREELIQQVETAKKARQEAVSGSNLFELSTIVEVNVQQTLSSSNSLDGKRVTCSAVYLNVLDGKKRIVIGTESGIYVGMEDDTSSFRLAIKDLNASDISILENYHLLFVLSGKVLKAYNMNCLEPNSEKLFQVGQQISKNVQYFTTGECAGKTLVITMKKKGTGAGESHFSAFEPLESASMTTQPQKGFGGLSLGRSKSDWFKLYREFYVASDSSQLQMLSKMVCVVCPRGFEVLMLDNLDETRVYPSKQENEFAFLLKRPESVPVGMFKINSEEFLMCYNDFAFTMTKNGNLAKSDLIEFEGRADSFALVHPYIIAFESQLIEIRHIETGALEQLIIGDNIRVLYTDVDLKGNTVIHVLMSHPTRGDVRKVVKLAKTQPKTLLEPVKYQPKSSYAPLNSAVTTPTLSSLLPAATSPQVTSPPSPYSPYRQNQVQQPLIDIPPVAVMPQRPSPRMAQQQPTFVNYQTTVANTMIYPAPAVAYSATSSPYIANVNAFPTTSSHYMASSTAYPKPTATPIYTNTTAAYPSTSTFGNSFTVGGCQPAPYNSESTRMPMPMPDVTPIQMPMALPPRPPISNGGFTSYPAMMPSSVNSNPYAPVNSMPYPQYPQVYPPPTNGHSRSPSPSTQQTWAPTGFL
ncbi:hypothetical protein BGX27_009707 [Mortierella sp. AM989]|nr:hypothetical protein BGX27_009707 [Mortierella sp. AM989]